MKFIDKICCAFGNHRYSGSTTKVSMVTDKVCRVEVQCVHCGKHNCFIADFNTNEMAQEGAAG